MHTDSRILVTGGNTGIGKAIAKQLLAKGCKVVITARNQEKGEAALEELRGEKGGENVALVLGDLSSINAVFQLAQQIKSHYSDINVLINNAGVWMTKLKLNQDGLEQSFMVNHVAPYLLARELLPTLQNNAPARIINVNAGLYVNGKLDLEATPTGLDFSAIKTYATTKLCSVLIALSQAEDLQDSGVTINSVHPGVINTGLGNSNSVASKIMSQIKRLWKSPDYGADAPVWLATDESVANINGKYFNERKLHEISQKARDTKAQKALRKLTDQLIEEALLGNS